MSAAIVRPVLAQELPGIPEGIDSEGTLAVLFMVLLGVFVVLAILYKGPALIAAWRAPGIAREKELLQLERERAQAERERTDQILRVLASNTEANERRNAEMAAQTAQLSRLSVGLHERVGPAISGLSIAFLIIAGQSEMAEEQEKKDAEKGYPPAQKFGGRKGRET